MEPETTHVCGNCRRPLNFITYDDENHEVKHWIHGSVIPGTPDHEPVPVPVDASSELVPVCDFCAEPHPPWVYDALPFIGPAGMENSVGAWGACETCRQLIDAEDYDALAARSVDAIPNLPRSARGRTMAYIRSLHEAFRTAKLGPARRAT